VRSTALFDVRIAYVAETIDVEAEAARLRKQDRGIGKRRLPRRRNSWLTILFGVAPPGEDNPRIRGDFGGTNDGIAGSCARGLRSWKAAA